MKRPYQKPTLTPLKLESAWGQPSPEGACISGSGVAGGTCGGGFRPAQNWCTAGSFHNPCFAGGGFLGSR